MKQPLTDEAAAILVKELSAMVGIKSMMVAGDTISITYDLLQATAGQIEARIGEVGGLLGTGWAERLQRGFVHYLEECEAGNLEVTPNPGHHQSTSCADACSAPASFATGRCYCSSW